MATPVTRNGGASLYVRCLVPRPLRCLIGRSEILKSLGSNNFSVGKLRAVLVKGRMPRLFLFIQQRGHTMTKAEIRALVARYIEERPDDWKENTYEPAVQESLRKGNLPDEEGGTEWQDSHALFSQSTVEDCEKALRSNDLEAIAPILEEFVAKYKLKIKPETLTFPQFRGHPIKPQPSSLQTRLGSHSRELSDGASGYRTPRYIRRYPALLLHELRNADGTRARA